MFGCKVPCWSTWYFLYLHILHNYFSKNIFFYFVLECADVLMRVAVELCVHCKEEMPHTSASPSHINCWLAYEDWGSEQKSVLVWFRGQCSINLKTISVQPNRQYIRFSIFDESRPEGQSDDPYYYKVWHYETIMALWMLQKTWL